jgi:hypothetical protein
VINPDLSYVMIPGKPFSTACPPKLYSRLFNHWLEFWSNEYRAYGSNSVIDPANFYRQDCYTAIMKDDTVVATHSMAYFDLRYDFKNFHYFTEMHRPETLNLLMAQKQNRILVQQYLMVNQEFSVRKTRLNLSAVMVMLSLKNQAGFDGTLTAARTEVGAASVALKIGFERISEAHLVHNVPVASLFCSKPLPYRRKEENDLADILWSTRRDYTNSQRSENESQRDSRQPSQSPQPHRGEISV